MAWIVLFASLTGLSALVKIPLGFTPVPITLQTAVAMAGGLILGRDGFWAQVLYLLLGCVGLPFFTPEHSNVQVLFGATGGYLIGFAFASYGCARWIRPYAGQLSWFQRYVRLLGVSMLIFVPGVLGLALFQDLSLSKAVMLGFVPFIAGDLIKTLLVSLISHKSFVL